VFVNKLLALKNRFRASLAINSHRWRPGQNFAVWKEGLSFGSRDKERKLPQIQIANVT